MKQFKREILSILFVTLLLSLLISACGTTPKEEEMPDIPKGDLPLLDTPTPEASQPAQAQTQQPTHGKTQVVLGGDLPDDPKPTWTQSALLTQEALANATPTATLPGTFLVAKQSYSVYQGGYAVSLEMDTHVSVRGSLTLIGSRSHPVNTLIIGNVSKYEMVPVDTLPQQVFGSLFGSDAEVTEEEKEDFELDGVKGIAMNYIARINQMVAKGRLVIVKPTEKRYIAVVGMGDPADPSGDQWNTFGVEFYEAILNGIQVLDDEILEDRLACPMAEDEAYGYSKDNPIRVGGDAMGGPARARAYLDNLQDSQGNWVAYNRQGSMEYGGTILDAYEVVLDGETVLLYVDQYSFETLLTPVGFSCGGAYPILAP